VAADANGHHHQERHRSPDGQQLAVLQELVKGWRNDHTDWSAGQVREFRDRL